MPWRCSGREGQQKPSDWWLSLTAGPRQQHLACKKRLQLRRSSKLKDLPGRLGQSWQTELDLLNLTQQKLTGASGHTDGNTGQHAREHKLYSQRRCFLGCNHPNVLYYALKADLVQARGSRRYLQRQGQLSLPTCCKWLCEDG